MIDTMQNIRRQIANNSGPIKKLEEGIRKHTDEIKDYLAKKVRNRRRRRAVVALSRNKNRSCSPFDDCNGPPSQKQVEKTLREERNKMAEQNKEEVGVLVKQLENIQVLIDGLGACLW